MNNKLITAAIALVLLISSCKKTTEDSNILLNQTIDVKLKEPVLLTFGSDYEVTTWAVTQQSGCTLNQVNNKATCSFTVAGKYNITATQNGKQALYEINVNSNLYSDIDTGFNITASKIVDINTSEYVEFVGHNMPSNIDSFGISPAVAFSQVVGVNSIKYNIKNNGTYTITARDAATKRLANITVFVNANHPNTVQVVPFILGEKIEIKPEVTKNNGWIKIAFNNTAKKYLYMCNQDVIISDIHVTNNTNFDIVFGGVATTTTLYPTLLPPTCTDIIDSMQYNNTYPFSIQYQNKKFYGSVEITSTDLHIHFDDNNFITITNKDFYNFFWKGEKD